jgi:predicted nucleic acid-binding protein
MTNVKVFVDTNVLLRSTIAQFPQHEQAKWLVDQQIEADAELWISRQVIREYIAQATRPQSFMHRMTIEQVESQLAKIRLLFSVADETEYVTSQLLQLLKAHATGGKQVHDANIVATMLVNGIDTLLTTNVNDMKRFAGKINLVAL